ncbi:uncharacterized protein LOC111248129 isoform X2 [Varroa destructor]|nr:uncharacterized protein LOC111248129 isoform X2 [Varroa destructor]
MPIQEKVDNEFARWTAFEEKLNLRQDISSDVEAYHRELMVKALRKVQCEIEQRKQSDGSVDQDNASVDETDWSDASHISTGSRSSRSQSLLSAKSKLKRSMSESSSRRDMRIVAPSESTTKRQRVANHQKEGLSVGQKANDTSTDDGLERESRSRIPKKGSSRNNSQSVRGLKPALPLFQNKISRPPSVDRAEFARAQNQRVQQAKERREQQQQTEEIAKDSKRSVAKLKSIKADSSGRGVSRNSVSLQKKVSAIDPSPNNPIITGTIPLANEMLHGQTLLESSKLPLLTHQVNSTFMMGAEARPMCDVTMIAPVPAGFREMPVHPLNTTYVPSATAVPNDVTFAKPLQPVETIYRPVLDPPDNGQIEPALPDENAANATVDDTLLNPMESYCNYGLEDLCSDSDNTDDECHPKKIIPGWARMDSARFRRRIFKQKTLGDSIEKYRLKDICMPKYVDLHEIFYSDIAKRDTSSLIWDTTQTFIA